MNSEQPEEAITYTAETARTLRAEARKWVRFGTDGLLWFFTPDSGWLSIEVCPVTTTMVINHLRECAGMTATAAILALTGLYCFPERPPGWPVTKSA